MKKYKTMKVVGISDLHGYLTKDLPKGDVLCICGDIVPLEYQNSLAQSIAWFLQDFTPWTDNLKESGYKYVLVIPGNHDFFWQELQLGTMRSGSDVLKKLYLHHKGSHIIKLLCDSSIEIEGRRFYGTPWIPDLERWAYYASSKQLELEFQNIPKRCDVIMTHVPARVGTQGMVLQQGWNYQSNFGCEELAEAIKFREINWALSGHVHSGNHNVETFDGTNFVNVSLLDEDYRVNYEPFVFEI